MGNETGSMLCLWIEPWGTGDWMRPGEELTEAEPEQAPLNVVVHDQGLAVWVNCPVSSHVDRSR
ncbi:hypothetical protein ACFV2H_49185 [Streptomyces sp. NPDC059629]|uniref:hypothetical protein n=1 Tax=Streptomyces sp. NPDC059629 TaxID=3346889 RepID=UPI0036B01DB4